MSKEIQQMFSEIASRYDLANDVLSFGMHRRWRKNCVKLAGVNPGSRVLDLCCGTGALVFRLATQVGSSGMVVGLDFVDQMLQNARRKQQESQKVQQNGQPPICFTQADALQLPFPDNSFDVVTIAFGIRNVDQPERCLQEMQRVLRKGGKAIILEFGRPRLPGFSALYRFYSKWLMPFLGGLVTGNRAAYRYLPETASRFPDGNDFLQLLEQAGFMHLEVQPLVSGVALAYLGVAD